jgi:hypothetical protein
LRIGLDCLDHGPERRRLTNSGETPRHCVKTRDTVAHQDRKIAPRCRQLRLCAFAIDAEQVGRHLRPQRLRRRGSTLLNALLQQWNELFESRNLLVEDLDTPLRARDGDERGGVPRALGQYRLPAAVEVMEQDPLERTA